MFGYNLLQDFCPSTPLLYDNTLTITLRWIVTSSATISKKATSLFSIYLLTIIDLHFNPMNQTKQICRDSTNYGCEIVQINDKIPWWSPKLTQMASNHKMDSFHAFKTSKLVNDYILLNLMVNHWSGRVINTYARIRVGKLQWHPNMFHSQNQLCR